MESEPNGYLDLWARDHRKSTIITYAGTIQDILASHGEDPLEAWHGIEPTFGIFSHIRPIARKFLRQIKNELQNNHYLLSLFPDILYANPERDSPKWSETDGLVVKRKSNPKEGTVEAWGLVDGQPTAAHYNVRVYDDVVTKKSVSTPDMIAKTTEAWELSLNLGTSELGQAATVDLERYIGTRYAIFDTYSEIMARAAAKPRIYPATHDGTESGRPVLLTDAALAKRKRQGRTTFSAQMLQKPISRATATFDIAHLKFIEIRPKTVNIYIMADPAHSKRRGSDRTAIPVIAVDAQRNKFLVDGFNHKMNLTERWNALKGLRKKWMNAPGVQSVYVGYERYGMQSDLEHFETQMKIDKEHFEIKELAWPREGPGAKGDRVGRLRPDFELGHFFLPLLVWHDDQGLCFLKIEDQEVKYVKAEKETSLMTRVARGGEKFRIIRPIKCKDEDGRLYDMTVRFVVEYLAHPAPGAFDDLIDGASRIYDMELVPPIIINDKDLEPPTYPDS